ncbi:MAG TPA: YraN family protein [Candidatus Accumulibacter sp.]|nr:YraN family protein [Accumulibacter sp.]HCN67431.1 YraN family protein [Accumulibacter sp.]HCV14123.1 YraN family protein [Accumulibacter sp.]
MSPRWPSGVGTKYNAADSFVIGVDWQVNGKDNTPGHAGTRTRPGEVAEDLAARFLEARGLSILQRNFRCRGGEVDLICRDGPALVFVEVRLRRNAAYGGAGASITTTKQRRIALAAEHYLTTHSAAERDCRFDCILLDRLSTEAIEWLRDAFQAP